LNLNNKSIYSKIIPYIVGVLIISIIRSGSIWHYSTYQIDEEMVVRYAAGFLGGDLNPRWFGYHTFPMYIISLVYLVLYAGYSLLGISSSKIEFLALLFSHNDLFFITARLVGSFFYILGCFVLSLIINKSYTSKTGSFFFFLSVALLPDGILASNWIRVDTFVFCFLAISIYFSSFAAKSFWSFLFSIIFCSAAFASKFPAIVFFPILFIQIITDVRNRFYPARYIGYFFFIALVSSSLLMPYMLFDFHAFRVSFDQQVLARASGQLVHLGREHYSDLLSRLSGIYSIIKSQVGMISILGLVCVTFVATAKERRLLIPVLCVWSYIILFGTSLTIESYWLRPIYPLLLFLLFILVIYLSRREIFQKKIDALFSIAGRSGVSSKSWVVSIACLALLVYYSILFSDSLLGFYNSWTSNDEDTRMVSSRWIQENMKQDSKIWLEGGIPNYFPILLSKDTNIARFIPLGFYLGGNQNKILDEAFKYYYSDQVRQQKTYELGILGIGKEENDFSGRCSEIKPGEYIILSSYILDRFYLEVTMRQFPRIAASAQHYYGYLRRQKPVASFRGNGPNIEIYLINEKPDCREWSQ